MSWAEPRPGTRGPLEGSGEGGRPSARRQGLRLDPQGWFGIAPEEWLDPQHTALLVIDMQNYDANRDWALIGTRGTGTPSQSSSYYYDRIEGTVVPAIRRLLRGFRCLGAPVVHALFASPHPGAPEMPPLWRLRFEQHAEDSGRSYVPEVGRPEMRILSELQPLPGEPVLPKVTGSVFLSTPVHDLFRYRGVRSFVACGVWLNSCVEDTIRVGADLGYLVTLAEDAAAAPDPAFHQAAVRVLGQMYCQVRDSAWILQRLGAAAEAGEAGQATGGQSGG
jgi:nicotinamidase-related amidase